MRAPARRSLERSGHPQGGFSLTELMIVVVMVSILASIAMVGFRKYVARARTMEAAAMIAEMSGKQQIYFVEFGGYLPLRADNVTTLPSADESPTAFFPLSPSASTFESSRTAVSVANRAAWPGGWRSVGLRPPDQRLYCTYLLNAGGAGQAVPAGIGSAAMGPVAATAPAWFYAIAACNMTGPAGYPANVTKFVLTSGSPTVRTINLGL